MQINELPVMVCPSGTVLKRPSDAEAGMCLLIGVLLVNALLPDPQLWPIYLVAGLAAALDGLQRPSLEAMIPRLVPHDQLAAAAAVSSLRWQIGTIAGPAVGGLVVVGAGVAWAYAIDIATFLVSLVAIAFIRAVPPRDDAPRPCPSPGGMRSARSLWASCLSCGSPAPFRSGTSWWSR